MMHACMFNTAGKDRQIHSAVATLKYYRTGAVRTCRSSLLSTHVIKRDREEKVRSKPCQS